MSVSATYLYPAITAWRTREYTPNITALRNGAARILLGSGDVTGDASGNNATVNLTFPDGYFQNRAGLLVLLSPANYGEQAAGTYFRLIVSLQEQARAFGYQWFAQAESDVGTSVTGGAGADIFRDLWIPPHDGGTSLIVVGENLNGDVMTGTCMVELWDTPAVAKA